MRTAVKNLVIVMIVMMFATATMAQEVAEAASEASPQGIELLMLLLGLLFVPVVGWAIAHQQSDDEAAN